MNTWRIERDENGPRRMRWIPPEVAEKVEEATGGELHSEVRGAASVGGGMEVEGGIYERPISGRGGYVSETKVEVWEFVDSSEDPAGYYAEGHVKAEEFRAALDRYSQFTDGKPYPEPVDLDSIKQVYCRQYPVDPDAEDSDLGMKFVNEKRKGYEPMTVMYS